MHQPLDQLARDVAELLSQRKIKIVFAESCTGGLVSATLARVPGVSNVHCGSAVVYRLDTKTQWLNVPSSLLLDPGPVSEDVARMMAEGVLAHTPEANVAAAITGHLGPDAPANKDGLLFVGIVIRGNPCRIVMHRLPKFISGEKDIRFPGETEREQRQWLATEFVLSEVALTIQQSMVDP